MNALDTAVRRMETGSMFVTESVAHAFRLFFGNSRHRHTVEERLRVLGLIEKGWPLDAEFEECSLAWVADLALRKDGAFRDTPFARRLGSKERAVVLHATHFKLVGMNWELQAYDSRCYPGLERFTDVYPIYRLFGGGDHFDYFYRPWQANTDHAKTGIVIVG